MLADASPDKARTKDQLMKLRDNKDLVVKKVRNANDGIFPLP
jgi:hypothetical protein